MATPDCGAAIAGNAGWLAQRLARSGAQVVIGPRTGSKTLDLQIPHALPPGPLAEVLPLRVWRVESLRPNVSEAVDASALGLGQLDAVHWRDLIQADARVEILARYADGHPAVLRHGKLHYCASIFLLKQARGRCCNRLRKTLAWCRKPCPRPCALASAVL